VLETESHQRGLVVLCDGWLMAVKHMLYSKSCTYNLQTEPTLVVITLKCSNKCIFKLRDVVNWSCPPPSRIKSVSPAASLLNNETNYQSANKIVIK